MWRSSLQNTPPSTSSKLSPSGRGRIACRQLRMSIQWLKRVRPGRQRLAGEDAQVVRVKDEVAAGKTK
jgi:hypothetical protein